MPTKATRRTDSAPAPAPVPKPPERRFLKLVLGDRTAAESDRLIKLALLTAVALIVIAPVVMWARYRLTYVTSQNAIVRGYITSVGAQIEGVVTSVEVDAGQPVRAGQILARFEDHQLAATAQRAQSQLEKAQRELEVEILAIAQEERRLEGLVTQASAQAGALGAKVDAAKTQLEDARVKYEHNQSLAGSGAIAQEDLRVSETTLRTTEAMGATAEADQRAAKAAEHLAQVELEGLAVRRHHVVVLKADVEAARAELALAEADLRAAQIRAPADGWVVRRIVEPGTSLAVGQPVVSLWLGPEVWVEAWIEEKDLAYVGVGSNVGVTVKPYPRRVFNGWVETIGVSTDYELPDAVVPQPRTTRMRSSPVVGVRVRLARAEGLFPGLSANVAIRKKARA